MSNVKKISIAVTHDMADTIKAAVKSGEYGSSSEVIRDALRGWTEDRRRREAEIEYLRAAWDKGIKSGRKDYRPIEDVIADAKASM